MGAQAACLLPAGLVPRPCMLNLHVSTCSHATDLRRRGTHSPVSRWCLTLPRKCTAYSRPLPPSAPRPSPAAQMQGAHAFKPPKEDVNSPDLYIPTMALWTYTLLVCAVNAGRGRFNPDKVYPLVRAGRGRGGWGDGGNRGSVLGVAVSLWKAVEDPSENNTWQGLDVCVVYKSGGDALIHGLRLLLRHVAVPPFPLPSPSCQQSPARPPTCLPSPPLPSRSCTYTLVSCLLHLGPVSASPHTPAGDPCE